MKHIRDLNRKLPTEAEVVPFTMERIELQIQNAINMNLTQIEAGLNIDEVRFLKSIRNQLKEAGFKSKFRKPNLIIVYWKNK